MGITIFPFPIESLSFCLSSLPINPHLDNQKKKKEEEILESHDEPVEAEKPLVTKSCLGREGRASVVGV